MGAHRSVLSTVLLQRQKRKVWSWPLHKFNDDRVWTFYQRCLALSAAKRMDAAQHLHACGFQPLDGRGKIATERARWSTTCPAEETSAPGRWRG